jgi:hypothetical protein
MRLTRICLSSAPVARYLPSGLKHTLRMYKSPVFVASSSTSTLGNVLKHQISTYYMQTYHVFAPVFVS